MTRAAECLEISFVQGRTALVDRLDMVHYRRGCPVAYFAKRVVHNVMLAGLPPVW